MRYLRFALIPAVLLFLPGLATPLFAQWEPDVRLTFNDSASLLSNNNAHCVAASRDTVHVVWYDNRSGNFRIYYKRSTDAGTTWGQDTCFSSGTDSSKNPTLAISGSTLHLVWQDRRDGNWKIFYKRSTDGGTSWGLETRLTDDTLNSFNPSLSASDTMLHLVWFTRWLSDSAKLCYKKSTNLGVSWSSDTCIRTQPGAAYTVYTYTACITSDNRTIHLVYEPGWGHINYRNSTDVGQTWSNDDTIAYAGGGTFEQWLNEKPCISAVGANVHVVWSYWYSSRYDDYQRILYKNSTDGGSSWGVGSTIAGGGYGQIFKVPSVYASGSNIHVVWFDDRNYMMISNEIYYRNSLDGGTNWQPETRLTNDSLNSINPFIAVQGTRVHVIWTDNRDGNYEIYYKRNLTGNAVEEIKSPFPVSHLPYSVRPNPFASFASVPGHSSERFALYDITGRRVGTYRGDRIGEGLAAGVYFVRSADGNSKPLRIVKIK